MMPPNIAAQTLIEKWLPLATFAKWPPMETTLVALVYIYYCDMLKA